MINSSRKRFQREIIKESSDISGINKKINVKIGILNSFHPFTILNIIIITILVFVECGMLCVIYNIGLFTFLEIVGLLAIALAFLVQRKVNKIFEEREQKDKIYKQAHKWGKYKIYINVVNILYGTFMKMENEIIFLENCEFYSTTKKALLTEKGKRENMQISLSTWDGSIKSYLGIDQDLILQYQKRKEIEIVPETTISVESKMKLNLNK
jgi:hypothetical protein